MLDRTFYRQKNAGLYHSSIELKVGKGIIEIISVSFFKNKKLLQAWKSLLTNIETKKYNKIEIFKTLSNNIHFLN